MQNHININLHAVHSMHVAEAHEASFMQTHYYYYY